MLDRMACGNPPIEAWLDNVRIQQTSNGYWLAWHDDGKPIDQVAMLEPDHPEGQECKFFSSWDDDNSIQSFVDYFENEHPEEGDQVLNLFIQDPETGEWY